MTPTIGRIVHYFPPDMYGGTQVPVPAIVTAVHGDDCVNLQVFYDYQGQPQHRSSVVRCDAPTAYRWMWPPREPAPRAESDVPIGGAS